MDPSSPELEPESLEPPEPPSLIPESTDVPPELPPELLASTPHRGQPPSPPPLVPVASDEASLPEEMAFDEVPPQAAIKAPAAKPVTR
jgi:hypothetical protein